MNSWFINWCFIDGLCICRSKRYKTLSFDTSEGTLISVDVSPNGKTIAFDLLGHIYLMPIKWWNGRSYHKGDLLEYVSQV
jgi:hypothetical protein